MGELEPLHGVEHGLVELVLAGARLRRNVEPLAEERYLLVVDAELENRPVGDRDRDGLDGPGQLAAAASSISFWRSASNCGWSGWKLRK